MFCRYIGATAMWHRHYVRGQEGIHWFFPFFYLWFYTRNILTELHILLRVFKRQIRNFNSKIGGKVKKFLFYQQNAFKFKKFSVILDCCTFQHVFVQEQSTSFFLHIFIRHITGHAFSFSSKEIPSFVSFLCRVLYFDGVFIILCFQLRSTKWDPEHY